jgi:hypothetical protein
MSDLSDFFLLFKEKIVCKSHLIKSNHRVLRKNEVNTILHMIIVPLFVY